jgi:chitodextrinase
VRSVRFTVAALLILSAGTLPQPRAAYDPGKPRNLEATADGPYAVDLDWRRVNSADFYYVYRDGNRVAEPTRSEYRDEGLQPATTYVYRVSAVDDDGDEGDLSDPVQVTTDALPGPTTPTDLVATAVGPYRIDLAWSPSESDLGIAFYRIFRDDNEVATTTETSFPDSNLEPETTYEYRVSAVDGEGRESDLSKPSSATTPAEPGPPPPQQVTATAAGPTQVNVTWIPPSAGPRPVQGYNVYREGELVGFVVSTAFADTGLSPETTYGYTVAAVDDRGIEGEWSEEASATTDAAQDVIPPAPPTGLRLAGSGVGQRLAAPPDLEHSAAASARYSRPSVWTARSTESATGADRPGDTSSGM